MKKLTNFIPIMNLIIGSTVFLSCNRNQDITPSFDFAPYVSAYTGGVISSNATIRIEFTQEQPCIQQGKQIDEDYFSFSPSLKGKTQWVNNKIIEFVPDSGELIQGKLYKVSFALGKLMDIDKKFKVFKFSFRVQERTFTLKTNGIEVFADNPELINAKGELCFSDIVEKDRIADIISCSFENKRFIPVVEGTEDPYVFTFSIKNIVKPPKSSKLTLVIDGKSLGINKKIKSEIKIPARGDFGFYAAELINEPENGIRLTFTEPLSENQDLDGLITLDRINNYVIQGHDNVLEIYFMRDPHIEDIKITIDKGLKNFNNIQLGQTLTLSMHVQALAPQIKMLTEGSILPDSKNLIIPFQAVSLQSVNIKVIRIYESNILMFLQQNNLKASKYNTNDLKRAGRLIYKRKLYLNADPSKSVNQWQNYSIDLQNIIKQEPGAIYRIEFSFSYQDASLPFNNSKNKTDGDQNMVNVSVDEMTESDENEWDTPDGYYDYYNDIDWEIYRWDEKDNPYHPSYYMDNDRKEIIHVLASNIGLISKSNSDNTHWASVTNLLTAMPIADAEVMYYNYQLQLIGSGKTDDNGFAVIKTKNKPFVAVASTGKEKTYLRLVDGEENSLSRFDVGGSIITKGLKGYIYGERGVWRPGDTLFLTFILDDPDKKIPANHPVSLELYNPRGQFTYKIIKTNGINGFYTFQIPTQPSDPTGIWNTYIKLGGVSFHKSLRIETIKPNRLKINLSIPGNTLIAKANGVPIQISSAWLTGVTADKLKTKVDITLSKSETRFKGFEKYNFTNPAVDFQTNTMVVFDGTLNDEGKVNFNLKTPLSKEMPGMLRAQLVCRVFEPGGDASIYTETLPFSPFTTYVGINFNNPKTYLETDVDQIFDIVTLNTQGKPVDDADLEYKIYKIKWNWWWENNNENLSSYINNTSMTPVSSGNVKTVQGKAKIKFRINYPEWGRYLVFVKDRKGQHATGGIIYVDWPEWRGRSDKKDPTGLKMLTFTTDKKNYETGETATLIIPFAPGGRALVAIENGSKVIQREWVELSSKEDTKYQFTITDEMAPNVYVHITLLQPHAQTVNDLPIRMYGVVPVFVNNKNTILQPQITAPSVIRPETTFTVKVKEKTGKPMTYTLAIVDDGLLDLTNFKTPNPWSFFYAREALGIRTWDMFDDVIGAFAGNYGSLFSIGGDEALKPANAKANRFKPVVRFIGPFVLKSGEEKTHTLKLPPYLGSVRVMVVAGQENAYGNTEKTIVVRSPLMILSSLPRVVSTNEEIEVPVNVFAMEKSVKNVTLKIETTGKLKIAGSATQSISFKTTGDKLVYFTLKSGGQTGIEKITISAIGNGNTSKESIEIDVRNPNPPIMHTENKIINANEEIELPYSLEGTYYGNWLKLEVSRIPFLDFSRRLDFIFNYAHYCSEQLVSTSFPLLYAIQLKNADAQEVDKIKKQINENIHQLYSRQLTNGGFCYWSGSQIANAWISSYVGNFLLLAKEKGFEVNNIVINKWIAYQRKVATVWKNESYDAYRYQYYQNDLEQAYRLYTLALANAPEMGAMNRLKEQKNLSIQAKWRLAAAYALCGKTKIGNEIIFNQSKTINPYSYNNSTYGSSQRDEAMILEALILLGRTNEAYQQAQRISNNLINETYFSTQSTAYALIAMGRLAEKMSGNMQFLWAANAEEEQSIKSANVLYQKSLKTIPLQGKVKVKNIGKGSIYVSLISKTLPLEDKSPAINNNLKIEVTYTTINGNKIDVSKLKQGTDFIAVIRIYNIGIAQDFTDISLTHIIPSGWEIVNERMMDNDGKSSFTYQDIRDDRVMTYFDLSKGKSIVVKIRLQATYCGKFLLPAILCEPMYNTNAQARTAAGNIQVIK